MADPTAAAIKSALVAKCVTLFPAAQVTWGAPSSYLADDIIAVQDISATYEMASMGSARSRREAYTVTVTISVYRGGDDQSAVTLAALGYLEDLETGLRADQTLGVTGVWSIILGGFDLAEELSTDQTGAVLGRVCEVSCSVNVQARI